MFSKLNYSEGHRIEKRLGFQEGKEAFILGKEILDLAEGYLIGVQVKLFNFSIHHFRSEASSVPLNVIELQDKSYRGPTVNQAGSNEILVTTRHRNFSFKFSGKKVSTDKSTN